MEKVTTKVSGFILGSPTIDHYGDIVVCSRFNAYLLELIPNFLCGWGIDYESPNE